MTGGYVVLPARLVEEGRRGSPDYMVLDIREPIFFSFFVCARFYVVEQGDVAGRLEDWEVLGGQGLFDPGSSDVERLHWLQCD